jgi:hypothetical protein
MTVPFLDLRVAYLELKDELDAACQRVMDVDPVLVGGPLRGATGPRGTSQGRGAERPSHDEPTLHPVPIPTRTP